MKKVSFYTLGCKLNFAETSTIGRQFLEHGYSVVDFDQSADVIVLNTCSVTEQAERECRQIVRRILRNSPDAFIVVTGCYAQLQPEAIASIRGVDLVVGTKDKFDLLKFAQPFKKKPLPDIFVSCIDDLHSALPANSADVGGRTRAFLKIQDGCDYPCAFCTIPLARGGSRSVSLNDIITQAREIASRGYKEIVLTGVNVGDYGRKINSSLLELLRNIKYIDGIERIRISSIEPNLLSYELVDFILNSDKFCNHFHIPLQSGSDNLLRKMRRRYSTNNYRDIVEYIKNNDRNASIGADVIVGFPGETDELFNETYDFISDLPVSYLHVFTYSERPKTSAVKFQNKIPLNIRHKRNEVLRRLGVKKRHDFYSSFIDNILPVLFEGNVHDGRIAGLTPNYIRVEVDGNTSLVNSIHNIKIKNVQDNICFGERINQSSHLLKIKNSKVELINN